jgi:hypothetical protein
MTDPVHDDKFDRTIAALEDIEREANAAKIKAGLAAP